MVVLAIYIYKKEITASLICCYLQATEVLNVVVVYNLLLTKVLIGVYRRCKSMLLFTAKHVIVYKKQLASAKACNHS